VNSITGLLLHVHTESDRSAFFVQLLEGPEAAVERTYERITNDELHHDLRVLSRGECGDRTFGDWSMRLEQISSAQLHGRSATEPPPARIIELVRDSYTVEKLILHYAGHRHGQTFDAGRQH
jgi:hypothetical protein